MSPLAQPLELLPVFARDRQARALLRSILIIILGSGLYGFTVGYWRAPEMALYVAIKTPALLFLTLLITGFLNGLLGLLLGSSIGFRQSLLCQLLAFSLAAIVLASLAPITFFVALQAPASDSASAFQSHSFYLLTHTALIGFGGFLAVTRLFDLIVALSPNLRAARLTLLSWLASNAFVGAQLSWLLRPFFGSPNLEVAFLRSDLFNGTFYESVWRALKRLLPEPLPILVLFTTFTMMILIVRKVIKPKTPN